MPRMSFAASFSVVSTAILFAATPGAGQTAGGQRGGQRGGAPAGPPMTLTVAGFPDGGQIPVKFSQAAEGAAPGEGTVAGDYVDQHAGGHAIVRAPHAR